MSKSETASNEIQINAIPGLRRLLGEEEWAVLIPIFVPDTTDIQFKTYREWLQRSIDHTALGTYSWCVRTEDGFRVDTMLRDQDGKTQRERERDALLQYLAEHEPMLKGRLDKLSATKGMEEDRWKISLSRILDLLIDSAETGFAEASWRELHRDDLREIVSLGIAREELLLKDWNVGEHIVRSVRGPLKAPRRKKR
jgi:hypothetical protein